LLKCVGAEAPSIRTGKNWIVWLPVLLQQPFFEDRCDIRAQRRVSHFSTFSEATDVSACAELHVLAAK
jgi:hypothetical protein